MQSYLIALDMDGTLLNSEGKISDCLAQYLHHLEEEGHLVVISSGRPIRAIQKYYDQLGLHSPVICYNGAFVTNPSDPSFKEQSFAFPRNVICKIYLELKDLLENLMCETNKEIWLLKEDQTLKDFFWHDDMEVHYGEVDKTLNQDPMTMILESRNREDDQRIIDAVKKHAGLNIRFWNGNYAHFSEVYFEHVSKAASLHYIAEMYQIPASRMIAIGDATNDIEMLSLAEHSVAMINGDEAVKKYAKHISRYDNDHDGVKYAIQDILEK